MKRGMCITYEVDGSLYINLTNRCTNNCDFCIRKNGEGAYGSDSLWLIREPEADEVLCSVLSRDVLSYREIVFCGYGEPTMRLSVLSEVARGIKEKYPTVKIRLNTNGHSDLINGGGSVDALVGLVDTLSISLNASTPERYCEICHPVHHEAAFYALIDYAKSAKGKIPSVIFSVVGVSLTAKEISECEAIAQDAGVTLRVRDYIGAEDDK